MDFEFVDVSEMDTLSDIHRSLSDKRRRNIEQKQKRLSARYKKEIYVNYKYSKCGRDDYVRETANEYGISESEIRKVLNRGGK